MCSCWKIIPLWFSRTPRRENHISSEQSLSPLGRKHERKTDYCFHTVFDWRHTGAAGRADLGCRRYIDCVLLCGSGLSPIGFSHIRNHHHNWRSDDKQQSKFHAQLGCHDTRFRRALTFRRSDSSRWNTRNHWRRIRTDLEAQARTIDK